MMLLKQTACGITTQMTGEVLEVAKDMETRSYREPLGVVAAICPFNFPAMYGVLVPDSYCEDLLTFYIGSHCGACLSLPLPVTA